MVQGIGGARIIAVAVPLSVTTSAYSVEEAVAATYLTLLGGQPRTGLPSTCTRQVRSAPTPC